MADSTEDQCRPTEPKPQTPIVFQTQSSRVTVGGRGPFVPYPAVNHSDGSANHGYRHLKGRPELIELIPEVDGWPELAAVLRFCNGDGPYMTIGCEKRFVLLRDDERGRPDGPVGYLNSYVDLAFAEIERNTPEELLELAKGLATDIGDMTASWVEFHFEIQTAGLFGATAHILLVWTVGYGRTEEEARKTWGYGCRRLITALDKLAAGASSERAL